MKDKDLDFHRSEMLFFGKVGAGISHEIKNGLAVIKEESGLVLDLIAMASKGRPPDPGRIEELNGKIMRRVDAVDGIVKDFNRFSHSLDDLDQVFDVRDELALAVRLLERFARMHDVVIEVVPAPDQLQIQNNPFRLHHLLSILVGAEIKAAQKGGRVKVAVEKSGNEICCVIAAGCSAPCPDPEQNDVVEKLLKSLNGKIEYDDEKSQTIIRFQKIYNCP